ncbi:hypothetical protein HN51_030894 [Arachis hypogaea]|uniref:protein terminal ear1 homolog n=1 Tax=Arachis hypogaea TaxID=3818 RepID=UPI0010FC50FD|nr:protein terminal ear1 [Arachis hypogaea]QHO15457.1 Protein terminal [Arachis hypogaea]
MGETGIIFRFPGNLDPRAQEFIPTNTTHTPLPQLATVFPLPHHPYTAQPSYPPYPYPYAPSLGVGVLPFHDAQLPHAAAAAAAVPFPHFTSAAYAAPPPPFPSPHLSTSPTRSLLLSPLPSDLAVSESSLRRELEVFGDVRGVQMEALHDGIVTVHFYDLRDAETALTAIRQQHMQHQERLRNHYASLFKARSAFPLPPPPPVVSPPAPGLIAGRAVWAQYVLPVCNAVPDGQNQGTVVVFNLDSDVSAENLKRVFEAFGAVKELRDTPSKKNQRFVEFYDVRDAAKALKEMDGKEIYGRKVVIEFSRPGGQSRKFFHSPASKQKSLNLNNVPPFYASNHPHHVQRKNSRRFGSSCWNSSCSTTFPQLPLWKSSGGGSKGSVNGGSDSGSVEAVGNAVSEEQLQRRSDASQKRSPVKESGEVGEGSVKHHYQQHHQQQHIVKSRHWKGKQGKKHETRFLIREDAIVESSSRDPRTTVMIKNIPNKYSQKLLLNMLDNHCIHCNEQIGDDEDQPLSSYDFVYLPIDFNNKCNVGYGFVNMTSPEATLRLYKAFHLQHWEVFNSRKICEVTYARVQGLEALKEHFKNSKFPCEMEHYLPVVFSPPRDGKSLTEPLPIVGNNKNNHHHHHSIIIPMAMMNVQNGVQNSDEDDDDFDDDDRATRSASTIACEDVHSSQSGGVCDDD